MSLRPSTRASVQDRRIGLHLLERSLAPRVLEALAALGYTLIDGEAATVDDARVRLVDSDLLDQLPHADDAPDLRLLLIGSVRPPPTDDARIFGRTTRPARLGAVYALIQEALEQNPRRTPRIDTRLSARCIRSDRRSIGAVLSLSEGGCLLRTRELLRKGSTLDVQFALPDYGLVSARAECRYVRHGDAGLAFAKPPPDVRNTIAHYVTRELAAAHGPAGEEALARA